MATETETAQKPKRRMWIIVTIVIIILFVLVSFTGIIVGIYMLTTGEDVGVLKKDAVGVIRLEGVISSSGDSGGIFGAGSNANPEKFAEDLKKAVEDKSVKAIVIRVNSPGGSPAASQDMYEEVLKAAKKKPVIASVAEVAASGSYYAISPVKEIMASRASDIGSIGVFIAVPNLEGLFKNYGVKIEIIKEGKFKAMGALSKPLTPEEKQILQDYAKEIYNQFIDDVAKARKELDVNEVRKLATGRTWPATQAKTLGLVDRFGNYQDAIRRAAKLGKIKGEPKVITYEDDDWFAAFNTGMKALENLAKMPATEKSFR